MTHSGRVKRISNPSQNLECFVAQVKAHFKELAGIEYLYPLGIKLPAKPEEEAKAESELVAKSKFVLRWHSQSPTDQSMLDQSALAVEVFD